MSLSFAFIGSRPDLARLMVRSHQQVLTVPQPSSGAVGWGAGFFHSDEVLLRRRPNESRNPIPLPDELGSLRCHALLAHVCDVVSGSLRTETTPPLRYGHMLFVCHGSDPQLDRLRGPVTEALPGFLRGQLKGDTFTELALSLFLSELPSSALERTRARSQQRTVEPLEAESLRKALRQTLTRLDEFCENAGIDPFAGGLWVTTGDVLAIAHRRGLLGLRALRRQEEFAALPGASESTISLDHARFTVAVSGLETLPSGWERLPDHVLVTAKRTDAPETEAL